MKLKYMFASERKYWGFTRDKIIVYCKEENGGIYDGHLYFR